MVRDGQGNEQALHRGDRPSVNETETSTRVIRGFRVAAVGTTAMVTGKVTDGSTKETVVAVAESSPPALTVATGNVGHSDLSRVRRRQSR